jgi:hypothetical protein
MKNPLVWIAQTNEYLLKASCFISLRIAECKQDVLGRTNRLLSFDTTWTAQKTMPPTILRCRGNVFTELLSSSDRGIHRQTHRHTRPIIILLLRVFIAAGTFLPRRCLSMKGGIHFTEPLPSNHRKDTHTDTQTDGRDL